MAGRSHCLRLLSKDVEKDKDGEKTFAEEEMAAEEEKGTDRAASDAAKPAAEATEGADRAEKAQGAGPGVVTATGEAQTETETKTVAEKPKASQEEEKAQESSKETVLAAQDDELEQRVTREVIGVLQETGSLEANDLVDLCEKIGCSHNVMARVVRMLVATPLVNELVLLGDVMRGDRRFIFRHGMGLGRRIDLATIDKQIAALEKDVKLAEQRAERISSLGKDPTLSSETLDKILVGQPETVKQLPVYTRLLRETSPPTSSS
ncbi:Hypothetical Protein FCC1311_007242 [Hondaea fermentalgiana]|uniref:Uncharacterized protein n=1 Tax=Hondaea fermentalgiana TaxID=2315210 RepID=A0A2R5G0E7_9STRA|nr:Hypothetical Protein FCC1311_007242 [Hondaea fermentalgiana]|eukprot:GBG24506.1 Hypothetical Protein FCC1311_007242 [Hondaea fermentalgiana]